MGSSRRGRGALFMHKGEAVRNGLIIGLTLATFALLVACGGGEATPTPSQRLPAAPTVSLQPAATDTVPPAAAGEASLLISEFRHQNATIAVGTKVTWTNRDPAPHTTTSGVPGSATGVWESPRLAQGDTFSFTFTQPGAYPYFCAVHPSIRATITVEAGPGSQERQVVAQLAAIATPTPTATLVPTLIPQAVTTGTPTPTATPTAIPKAVQESSAHIANFVLPSTQLAMGTTLTWTNHDNVTHTVTSGVPGSPTGVFDSGSLSPGQSYSHTFIQEGTYPYFCKVHESLRGTITVVGIYY